jgi:hypothetical protein
MKQPENTLSIQFRKSEHKEFYISDTPELRTKGFYFSIEGFMVMPKNRLVG